MDSILADLYQLDESIIEAQKLLEKKICMIGRDQFVELVEAPLKYQLSFNPALQKKSIEEPIFFFYPRLEPDASFHICKEDKTTVIKITAEYRDLLFAFSPALKGIYVDFLTDRYPEPLFWQMLVCSYDIYIESTVSTRIGRAITESFKRVRSYIADMRKQINYDRRGNANQFENYFRMLKIQQEDVASSIKNFDLQRFDLGTDLGHQGLLADDLHYIEKLDSNEKVTNMSMSGTGVDVDDYFYSDQCWMAVKRVNHYSFRLTEQLMKAEGTHNQYFKQPICQSECKVFPVFEPQIIQFSPTINHQVTKNSLLKTDFKIEKEALSYHSFKPYQLMETNASSLFHYQQESQYTNTRISSNEVQKSRQREAASFGSLVEIATLCYQMIDQIQVLKQVDVNSNNCKIMDELIVAIKAFKVFLQTGQQELKQDLNSLMNVKFEQFTLSGIISGLLLKLANFVNKFSD